MEKGHFGHLSGSYFKGPRAVPWALPDLKRSMGVTKAPQIMCTRTGRVQTYLHTPTYTHTEAVKPMGHRSYLLRP